MSLNRRLVLLTLLAAGCTPGKPQFKAVDITGAEYARDFPLPDAPISTTSDVSGIEIFIG